MCASPTVTIQSGSSRIEESKMILEAQKYPAQFQALYERWASPVYRYFYHQTGNLSAAEDLTSQLFLSAMKSLPRYRERGHFAAWLFTIARNLFKEYYRKKKREVPLEMARRLSSPSDPAAEFTRADEIEKLVRLVRSLPEEQQELIRLRYVAGLSFADMALVLKKRENTIKKSLYRLQDRLQSQLEHDYE